MNNYKKPKHKSKEKKENSRENKRLVSLVSENEFILFQLPKTDLFFGAAPKHTQFCFVAWKCGCVGDVDAASSHPARHKRPNARNRDDDVCLVECVRIVVVMMFMFFSAQSS